jgi:hypothetical protein
MVRVVSVERLPIAPLRYADGIWLSTGRPAYCAFHGRPCLCGQSIISSISSAVNTREFPTRRPTLWLRCRTCTVLRLMPQARATSEVEYILFVMGWKINPLGRSRKLNLLDPWCKISVDKHRRPP